MVVDRLRSATAAAGVEQVAQAVAGQVERQDQQEDRQPGEERVPGRLHQVAPAGRQVCAPGWSRRLSPQAEEGERRLVQDGKGEAERDQHHDRPEGVRQDRAKDDARPARPERTYSRSFSAIIAPRATRANSGIAIRPMAITALRSPLPKMAMIAIAIRITGKANSASRTRPIMPSTQPPL